MFKDRATHDIFHGIDSEQARKALPRELHWKAARLLDRLFSATAPHDLRTPKSHRLHRLHGDLRRLWSLRINEQYRIVFEWKDGRPMNVRITDYH